MKKIKGLSALMLAIAFMFSTAAFAAPVKAAAKRQNKMEKKAPVKKSKKVHKKSTKKKMTKKHSKKKAS